MVEVSANVFKNNHEQGLGLCIPSGEALGDHWSYPIKTERTECDPTEQLTPSLVAC